jgi:hypothetical protein
LLYIDAEIKRKRNIPAWRNWDHVRKQSEINNNVNKFCSVWCIRNALKAMLQTAIQSTYTDDVEASGIRAEAAWFVSLQLFDPQGWQFYIFISRKANVKTWCLHSRRVCEQSDEIRFPYKQWISGSNNKY